MTELVGYLDPATASIVFQAVVGGFLGALLAIKMYWRQVRAFFVGLLGHRRGVKDDGE